MVNFLQNQPLSTPIIATSASCPSRRELGKGKAGHQDATKQQRGLSGTWDGHGKPVSGVSKDSHLPGVVGVVVGEGGGFQSSGWYLSE